MSLASLTPSDALFRSNRETRSNLLASHFLKFPIAVVLIAASSISTIGAAQEIRTDIADSTPFRSSSLVLVTSEAVDRFRLNQLVDGVAPGQSLLLRSASSLTPRGTSDLRRVRVSVLSPQELFVHNTALPFSQNYGALWAGRGLSTRTLLGFRLETPRVRVIVAPELISSENSDWVIRPFPFDQHVPVIPP